MLLEYTKNHLLFKNIGETEIKKILNCTGAAICKYGKGELISRTGHPFPKIGILLSGSVVVARDDLSGNRCVLEKIKEDGVFGLSESITADETADIYCLAEKSCEIIMMDAKKFIGCCTEYCQSHHILLCNALRMIAEKKTALTRKLCHMSQHTLRGKLLSFLTEQAVESGTAFTIEYNRQELADYLGVDRSALCAELSRMKRDGLIKYEKHTFIVY